MTRWSEALIKTPFHPQWLLGKQRPVALVRRLRGQVLDVGCGDQWVKSCLQGSVSYLCTDFPTTGALYGSRPHFFASAAQLPLPSDVADAVICLEVLEHVEMPERVLREIHRVIRSNGTLLLSVPFLYPVHDAPHDHWRYTAHGLRKILEAAGFSVQEVRRRGHALHVAGALMTMALVGGVVSKPVGIRLVLLPPLALTVLLINLLCRAVAAILPDWDAISAGHVVLAQKL